MKNEKTESRDDLQREIQNFDLESLKPSLASHIKEIGVEIPNSTFVGVTPAIPKPSMLQRPLVQVPLY